MTEAEMIQVLEQKPDLWYAYKGVGYNYYVPVKTEIQRLILGSSQPNGSFQCTFIWEPDGQEHIVYIPGTRVYLTKEEALVGLADIYNMWVWPGEEQTEE